MRIIVGSYKLKAVAFLLDELAGFLPGLEFFHQEFAPAADLCDLSRPLGSNRSFPADKLLAALLNQQITTAVYRPEMLPVELPDEIDRFSLPERYLESGSDKLNLAAGGLTLLFRRGDAVMPVIRNLLLPPVIFAGAGIGGIDNVTLGVMNALKDCDVCIYDALIPDGIIDFLAATAEKIFVGKRSGRHYKKQKEINRILLELGKSGKKVVRLKGGDPSVFGRLAEEVKTLQQAGLSFRVLPGITTLNVAAASSGLLPSRRGVNRGFTVSTPRRAGSHTFVPFSEKERQESFNIYYMAANLVPEIVSTMLDDGFSADWPISLIYDAGNWDETVICGTLADIKAKISRPDLRKRPALVMTGAGAAAGYLFQTNAALEKMKIIVCGFDRKSYPPVKRAIENYGGRCMFVDAAAAGGAGEADFLKSAYEAIIFLDTQSRRVFYEKFGPAALSGKFVVAVTLTEDRHLGNPMAEISDEFTDTRHTFTASDVDAAVLSLAGYLSNRKIELKFDSIIRMESCNGG